MFEDFISALAERLGTTSSAIEFIFAVAMITAIGLTLAVLRVNFLGIIIVLIASVAVLSVMGWFPTWVIIIIILALGAMFATQMYRWMSGQGGN